MHLDSGQEVIPSESQQWLWRYWLQFWQDVERAAEHYKTEPAAVINGDWGDIIHTKNGPQLIEHENRNVVLEFMTAAVKPASQVCKNQIYVVRGTEAHAGGAGWLEEAAANKIGAQVDPQMGLSSFWVLRLKAEGVRFLIAHHPMTTGRTKSTMGSAANRAAASVMLDYYSESERPDVAIFGHVHHSEDSYDNQRVRTIYTPPWCLSNAYSHRIGAALAPVEQVGGIIIVVDGDKYRVFKRYYQTPPEERAQWIAI
jgi:predicted phosphodiesterase